MQATYVKQKQYFSYASEGIYLVQDRLKIWLFKTKHFEFIELYKNLTIICKTICL